MKKQNSCEDLLGEYLSYKKYLRRLLSQEIIPDGTQINRKKKRIREI